MIGKKGGQKGKKNRRVKKDTSLKYSWPRKKTKGRFQATDRSQKNWGRKKSHQSLKVYASRNSGVW